jgi:protein-disulfide isomerase
MSKRQEIRDKQRRKEMTNRILTIIGISVAAVLLVGIIIWPLLPQALGEIKPLAAHPHPQAKLNGMGDPNAPVKMIEYADFQCPFCGNFFTSTESQIIETYVKTGKVYLEYQPVVVVGPESVRAGEAAWCAGDQDKFWDMHDMLFGNQIAENAGWFRDARLSKFAEMIGLDMAKFNDCFGGGKYKSKVNLAIQDAIKNIHTASNFNDVMTKENYPADGLSTPTFMINNTMVAGAQPFASFQAVIDAALAGK